MITAVWIERYPGGTQGSVGRAFATSSLEDPTYYWLLNGVLAQQGPLNWFDITALNGELLEISVFDDANYAAPQAYTGRHVIGWDAESGAASYPVERYVDSAWEAVREVPDRGESYFEILTDYLDDETEHVFRVGAKGADGNTGAYCEFRFDVVRRPTTEAMIGTFDSVTGFSVEAAA